MDSYLAISLVFWIDFCRNHPIKFLIGVVVYMALAMLITYLLICYFDYNQNRKP